MHVNVSIQQSLSWIHTCNSCKNLEQFFTLQVLIKLTISMHLSYITLFYFVSFLKLNKNEDEVDYGNHLCEVIIAPLYVPIK